ncbi:MAG: GNAT family N-acetyltransferase [Candidatus Competibacteraceae bacterium]|nr:GNAT family N-acetyltransferase [Candidatus Competibacteraceae bacterium]MBK8896426.1 GNAT family N-acetyltransferase [Candidatus Competibacteraceae bacterium]
MEPVLNAQSPYLADLNSPFPSAAPSSAAPRALKVELARSLEAVRAAQRLRYAVFAGEMGAKLHNWRPGLDHDRLDPFCQHLIVRDGFGQVVGCTRILTAEAARRAGGFYSEREFDLTPVLALPGTFMEIGRTCVHPDYRNGATIGTLWSGLAAFVAEHAIDYLIGCASIPAGGNGAAARALYVELARRYLVAEALRVRPRRPLPRHDGLAHPASSPPPLLKAYLRLGAKISGEPCLDPDFNVADVLILLPTRHIERRYARHFLDRDL